MKSTINHLAILFLLSVSTMAKTEPQEAHIHGLANLTLALENEVLEIQFESPAENLVGFEHNARSPEEKSLVHQTKTILESPTQLFSFLGTNCKSTKTTVDISEIMGEEDGHHEDHGHSQDAANTNHSEITAVYRVNCKDTGKLDSVAIKLFDHFPKIEKMKAMWVTKNGQGSNLLFPDRNIILLR